MSLNRFAKRADSTQAQIVKDLRKLGYIVEVIGKPVDLAVRHPSWIPNVWVLLEVKTENRKDGFVPRKDQIDQTLFCDQHQVPYITSSEHAIAYLDVRSIELVRT